MKKINIVCGLLLSLSLLLTGCTNPFDYMPNLTEEESALITEYAAGILIKHDKYAGRLADDWEIIYADEKAAKLEAAAAEYKERQEALAAQEEEAKAQEQGNGEEPIQEPVQTPFAGIASFCGVEGFEINYTDYTICDSYPEEDSDSAFFAMDATEGNQLLVLRFIAENLTAEDKELDMLGRNIRFRINVNGDDEKSALSTLLLDDLASYREVIPAQTGVQLVLIREIPNEVAASVDSISLTLKNASDNVTTVLK